MTWSSRALATEQICHLNESLEDGVVPTVKRCTASFKDMHRQPVPKGLRGCCAFALPKQPKPKVIPIRDGARFEQFD